MDWLAAARDLGIPAALLFGLGYFAFRSVWPFVVKQIEIVNAERARQIENANAERVKERESFLAALAHRDKLAEIVIEERKNERAEFLRALAERDALGHHILEERKQERIEYLEAMKKMGASMDALTETVKDMHVILSEIPLSKRAR